MKSTSVWQPWAHAILHLGKPVENRERRDGAMPELCRHRGLILLHASKSVGTRDDFDGAVGTILRIADLDIGQPKQYGSFAEIEPILRSKFWYRPAADLPRGALVGVASVSDCIHPAGKTIDGKPHPLAASHWYMGGFAAVLTDVRAFSVPRPYKGAQGLFDVDDALVAELLATCVRGAA